MSLKEWLPWDKHNLVNNTGMLAATNWMFSLNESLAVRLTEAQSWGIRAQANLWGYLGLATVYAKGREKFVEKTGMKASSSGFRKWATETGYNALFNAVAVPLIYSLEGETNPEVWASAIGSTALFLSPTVGPVAGMGIELFQSLTGVKPEGYEPKYNFLEKVSDLKKSARVGIAATAIVASVGLMKGIYEAVPDSWARDNQNNHSQLEQLVEQD